jgi:hypothetical protein
MLWTVVGAAGAGTPLVTGVADPKVAAEMGVVPCW